MNKKLLVIISIISIFSLFLAGCSGTGGNTYSLTVNIVGEGVVRVDGQNVLNGEVLKISRDAIIILDVIPALDWEFNQWAGENGDEVVPEGSSFKLVMDGNKEITAVFVETADIIVDPTFSGMVAEPPWILNSIEAAINAANSGDVIEVCEGIYNENLTINEDITLRSTFPLDPDVRDATVIAGVSSDSAVIRIINDCHLYGLTVQDGISSYSGGGIYINTSTAPVVEYNKIIDNEGVHGGGLEITGGSQAVIANNIFENNNANIGGGIFIYNSEPEISNNSILNNFAADNGGGIAVYYNSESTIYNNTITGNEADADDSDSGSGGGIYVSNDSDIKDDSGNEWDKENTPPAEESNNTYSSNTHYDGSNTDSSLNGADVYWWLD